MRGLLIIVGCLLGTLAFAQEISFQRSVKIVYTPSQLYSEKAVEAIEAINHIPTLATVDYTAGRSIVLNPGFRIDAGAVFTAHIKSIEREGLRLTAYPSPFDQSTTLEYVLPEAGSVDLYIVDSQGRTVSKLLNGTVHSAGRHQYKWTPNALPSNVYIPVLETGRSKISTRVIKK